MIKKISHVMLWSKNLERTQDWYKSKLGFSVHYLAPGDFLSMRSETMGRLDFHADSESGENVGRGAMPYFMVENLDAVKSWLESRGVRVEAIQQEGDSPKHTWFFDCEGNSIGLEEF